MERIDFTTRVLGTVAAYRLEKHQVTQTLRSESNGIVTAIINQQVTAGEKLEIVLDNIPAGETELLSMDAVTWDKLDIEDAHRGGFDSLDGMESSLLTALRRAGFRFQPLNDYHLFRIQFRWLEKVEV